MADYSGVLDMGVGRIAVLALAAAAAAFVGLYVRNAGLTSGQAAPEVQQVVERVETPTERVLVARRDLTVGQRVSPDDLTWQPWPLDALSETHLTQTTAPNALARFAGAIARVDVARGEPITGRRLVNPGEAGFMAAMLTPGMRAVAIPISAETGAGGFVLPGDRVDVILSYEVEIENGRETRNVPVSRTILENVRVLAIDQLPGGDEDAQVYVGSTATLEVTPADAEIAALAVTIGDVSLALRSVADRHPDADLVMGRGAESGEGLLFASEGQGLTVYRYGRARTDSLGGGR